MGHERVEALPRTKRWQDVVGGISDAASVDGNVRGLADATLENVRSRLLAIHGDTGFVASFQFLLGLALSASPGVDRASLGELAVDLARSGPGSGCTPDCSRDRRVTNFVTW